MLSILLTSCFSNDDQEIMKSTVSKYRENYNAMDFSKNYDILSKGAKMEISSERYRSDMSTVFEKMGKFERGEIATTDYTQKTADGRDTVVITYDSNFSKGSAREVFIFIKGPKLYRYELSSKNLLEGARL